MLLPQGHALFPARRAFGERWDPGTLQEAAQASQGDGILPTGTVRTTAIQPTGMWAPPSCAVAVSVLHGRRKGARRAP